MSYKQRLFKAEVPIDLVEKFFRLVGVTSLDDFHWWPKTFLTKQVCEEMDKLLVELEPYYQPHKKFLVIREMTPNRYVQVMRQLAKEKGYILESIECRAKNCDQIKKTTNYRLKRTVFAEMEVNPDLFTVHFN